MPFARVPHFRKITSCPGFRLATAIVLPVFLVVGFEVVNGISNCFFIAGGAVDCHLINHLTIVIEDIKVGEVVGGVIPADFIRTMVFVVKSNERGGKPGNFPAFRPVFHDNDKTIFEVDGITVVLGFLPLPAFKLLGIRAHFDKSGGL